ncbi:MAG TPA: efflux RND transporter periplasmic adaptor subunit [Arenimonas sp.]|nr:MAG: efflux transporter periplasmic adaptor subunit [Xanthomonadales bacterium GWF1_69_6]HBD20438.1 efflux RND transporter periplasmic adaptor subunit [Arenimonas sp.]
MDSPQDLLKQLHIDRRPAKKRRPRWLLPAAVVAVLVAGVVVMSGLRPVAVETAVARKAAELGTASVLDASGYVTARRIATVSSKITGKVREVLIEEGQVVAEGEVLAYLDDADAAAQRDLASAQLASAQSQLAEARAQLTLAEQTLVRQRELAAQKLVAASALDTAVADRDARAARLASLQRAVKVAQDQLAIAGLGVDNTVIRAPFAGVIVAKAAQPGEMISPISAGGGSIRTGIGTLVDMDSLEVQVDVNEANIGRVTPKMPVEAVLNAYPDWKIPAEVIAIVPTADRTKATVKVRIALKEKDPRIVPDMGVRVSFLDPAGVDAPPPSGAFVPERAVVTGEDGSAVFVVADGVARRVAVTLGEKRDADQQVTAGLEGGETVVLSPPEGLGDGDRVATK